MSGKLREIDVSHRLETDLAAVIPSPAANLLISMFVFTGLDFEIQRGIRRSETMLPLNVYESRAGIDG